MGRGRKSSYPGDAWQTSLRSWPMGRTKALAVFLLSVILALGWVTPASASAGIPDQAATSGSVVVNPDGSATLTLSGTWAWNLNGSDCNLQARAVGFSMDWNDPALPGNLVTTLNGVDIEAGVADPGNAANPTDNDVHPTPNTLFPAGPYGGCGNFDAGAGQNAGTWGPISHTYGAGVNSFEVCVLIYDVHLDADGGSPTNATQTQAGGTGHNGDSSAEGNGADNACVIRTFTRPAPPPDFSIAKTADPMVAGPGDTVTYQINVTNTGGSVLHNLVVSDVVPSGTTYVAGSATGGGAFDAVTRTLTWNVSSLDIGATVSVSYKTKVGTSAPVHIVNSSSARSDEVPLKVSSVSVARGLPTSGAESLTLVLVALALIGAGGAFQREEDEALSHTR